MKKVLLTTSALTLLAGAAAAQVSVGGDARMGVIYNDNPSTGGTTVDYRYRVKFNASGETDGGLSFGASMGIRIDDGDVSGFTSPVTAGSSLIWGPKVYIGNGAVTVSVGNTAGAIESHSGIWNGTFVGYSGMTFAGILFVTNTSSTTNGMGTNKAHVAFSLGNVNIAVSAPLDSPTSADTEVAANFSLGAGTIGIGYDMGENSGTSAVYVTASFDLGNANVFAGYVAPDAGGDSWQLGVKTEVGAGTVKAYIANIDPDAGGPTTNTSRWGIGYNQSLGGGASLGVGIENNGSNTYAEAGVSFKF